MMNQKERRLYLIERLLKESLGYRDTLIPADEVEQWRLLRSLMNMRAPKPVDSAFLCVQNEFLSREIEKKGVTEVTDLKPIESHLYLWRGDITTLRCDGIVNAANSRLLGCFCPCHGCIDNAIHTFAGVQLRLECAEVMRRQGSEEPTGQAKLTSAYNLPCHYVLHTVGPAISGHVCEEDRAQLRSCYRSCLALAEENHLRSLAFCCISTGEFAFPHEDAARIAVAAVSDYRAETGSKLDVIFNVFSEIDYEIYRRLLG
jgi:UPF0189 protein in tap1-dppD intergenic region